MKKALLLILLILLTGGCKVEYNLLIEEDLKIYESVNMTGTDSFFDIYYKSSKLNVVELLLEEDKETLDKNNYNYQIIDDETPYVLADKTYDDMASFAEKSIFYKQYFDQLNYSLEDGIVTLSTSGFKPNDPEDPSRYSISDMTIAITSKYKVVNHNANRYDGNTNTYYWNIGANTTDLEILLSYNPDIKFDPYVNTYIIIFISIVIIIMTWIIIVMHDVKQKKKKKKEK